jgi:hypothetical protein
MGDSVPKRTIPKRPDNEPLIPYPKTLAKMNPVSRESFERLLDRASQLQVQPRPKRCEK